MQPTDPNEVWARLPVSVPAAVPPSLAKALARLPDDPDASARDESFWKTYRALFSPSEKLLNLNYGGVSAPAEPVREFHRRLLDWVAEAPEYHLLWEAYGLRERVRLLAGEVVGAHPSTLAFTRNTTESLNTFIWNWPLDAGDEIVLSRQDYPNVVNAWTLRAQRDSLKLVWVDAPVYEPNADAMVSAYTAALTPQTKVVTIVHLNHWTGRIQPADAIIKEVNAFNPGIATLVDAAHSVGQLPFRVDELGCTALGTSLHKWIGAPWGVGLLYVSREALPSLPPLFPAKHTEPSDIRKFEGTGTDDFTRIAATQLALELHQALGTARKQARLHYLKTYWMLQAANIPGVELLTPLESVFSAGLAQFQVEGLKPEYVRDTLQNTYNIRVAGFDHANVSGVRVTPQVYTTPADLDRFLTALNQLVAG